MFIATREWQTVKKGVPIPAGLHVRYNFQTGVTEAKLMDDEEENESINNNANDSKSLTLHPEEAIQDEESQTKYNKESNSMKSPFKVLKSHLKEITKNEKVSSKRYSIKELEAKLNKLKNIDKSEEELKQEKAQSNSKKDFKSYETIKKELNSLKMNVTTESELLKAYFEKFQAHKESILAKTASSLDVKDILDILNNLEYLIHQIDNAQIFADMNGMTKIISPCLNSTNNKLQAEALRLLGAAVQSNPKVQIKALENDFIQKLLHMLSASTKTNIRSRCLFAISALIRQFPAAQKVLIDHGGLEIFGEILIYDQEQIQLRVMNLINDLVIERQDLNKLVELKQQQLKIKEYDFTNFEKKLQAQKYCKHLTNLMIKYFKENIPSRLINGDLEFIQVILESMTTVSDICKNDFSSDKKIVIMAIDVALINLYENSPSNDEKPVETTILLMKQLKAKLFESLHDEL
ncbi:nucleotide exchange factor Sil1 isoform X2 [Prorops nasuta]